MPAVAMTTETVGVSARLKDAAAAAGLVVLLCMPIVFLHADADERRALLQKLFRTDRFRTVEAWLAERRKTTRDQVEKADQALATLAARIAQVAGALPDVSLASPGLSGLSGLSGVALPAPGDGPGPPAVKLTPSPAPHPPRPAPPGTAKPPPESPGPPQPSPQPGRQRSPRFAQGHLRSSRRSRLPVSSWSFPTASS